MKKFLSLLLSVIMVLSIFVVPTFAIEKDIVQTGYAIPSEAGFIDKLNQLRSKYPNGGTYSGTYYENGVAKAWTCYGYACQMMYEVFGAQFYNDGFYNKKDYNMGTIYAGDFVRLDAGYGPDTHSVFVTKVTSDRIYFTDGNFNNKNGIRWDASYTKSEFANRFTYKVHIPGNTLTGNGTHTHNYNTYVYYWASHPHYKCYKCSCGEIKENINEPTYVESCSECYGYPSKPTLNIETSNYSSDVTFLWNATSNTSGYELWIFDLNTSIWIDTMYLGKEVDSVVVPMDKGNYFAVLKSINYDLADTSRWWTESDAIQFSVTTSYPSKPTLNIETSNHSSDVTFLWNATSNTSGYELWIFDLI